ncbi:MAG TPA: TIGR03435 family protein [Bryobacteraceae bacterium]|nr:TIGR03435 family protein [Bryobacteraceae bacterium]
MGHRTFAPRLCNIFLGMAFLAGTLTGGQQSAVSNSQAFEVASVKPAKPGVRGYAIQPVPGGLKVVNASLRMIIAEAWHLYDFQVLGGPKWLDEDRFDIDAKAAGGTQPTKGQLREMLQRLLAERFGVGSHRESRMLPVYVLEVAKGGSKMRRSNDEGDPYFRLLQRRQITAERAELSLLTVTLSELLGRPVLDKTGLEGKFAYKLEWTPDATQVRSSDQPVGDNDNIPSLSSAVQEQLGLRLSSQKGPVEILVVDRAEKPSAN